MPPRLRIGCSSWTSEAWWGKVYPPGVREGDRLGLYARLFDTVEVDSTYYRPPTPYLVRRWAAVTPEEFLFTLKFPRDLLDPRAKMDREALASFQASVRLLGNKLGPLLLQFPPWFKPGRNESYLQELLDTLEGDLRFSVELRDAAWYSGEVGKRPLRSLRDRNLALTWSYLTYLKVPAERTSDFLYLRFIGDHDTVPDSQHGEIRIDRREVLSEWASHLKEAFGSIESAYVYFNNHFAGFAPASVNHFREELGLPPVDYAAGVRGGASRLPES